MILKTNKTYKTIKHIVLCWGDRELLRYPYPIILAPLLKGFWPEEYVSEISHPYRDTSFSIYFTVNYEAPMHLKTKFSKMELIFTPDVEEEEAYDRPPQPLKDYELYFRFFLIALVLSPYSGLVYDIYSEMFSQSQLVVRNMDLDKQDFFEGIEDIKIDVSKPSYREDFLEAQRCELSLAKFGVPIPDPYFSVESYYQAQNYRYGLEESKNLLLAHLGEQNSAGYSGVNENFFKHYNLRLQLVVLFRFHYESASAFGFPKFSCEELERINLWKEPIFVDDLDRDYLFLRNIGNAERFYLRRFYRKFRLLNR